MINDLISMKIAWDNLVLNHLSMFYAQRRPDGNESILLNDGGTKKLFQCVKLSFALPWCPGLKMTAPLESCHNVSGGEGGGVP